MPFYEKGRSYILMDNNNQTITSFKIAKQYPKYMSAESRYRNQLLYYQKGDYNRISDLQE